MDEQMLRAFLKEHLKIQVENKVEHGRDVVRVYLLLDDEVIDNDYGVLSA